MSVYKNILLAVDIAEPSQLILDRAKQLAEGGDLHIAYVLEPLPNYYGGEIGVNFSSIEKDLFRESSNALKKIADSANIPLNNQHTLSGRSATKIKELAKELNTDLLVIGSHGQHGLSLLLGSTANGVLHGSSCDVLAVRIS